MRLLLGRINCTYHKQGRFQLSLKEFDRRYLLIHWFYTNNFSSTSTFSENYLWFCWKICSYSHQILIFFRNLRYILHKKISQRFSKIPDNLLIFTKKCPAVIYKNWRVVTEENVARCGGRQWLSYDYFLNEN